MHKFGGGHGTPLSTLEAASDTKIQVSFDLPDLISAVKCMWPVGCVKKNFFLNFQKVVSSFVATIEKIT